MIEALASGLAGGMVKMSIEKWSDKPSLFSTDAFYLMLNPEQYSEEFSIEYAKTKSGINRKDPKTTSRSPDKFSFDFILDGTGAAGIKIDVASKIREFKELVTGSNKDGRENFLRIKWGSLQLKCVFDSASIHYTFFSRTGRPLRAKLSVSFTRVHSEESPFLSKLDQYTSQALGAGQNIAQIASKAYGSTNKIASLARHNNLNSFRNIPTGTNLLFPPQSIL